MSFSYKTVADIQFGAGKIFELTTFLKGLGISKPMVITDSGIVEAGLFKSLSAVLESSACPFDVYDKVVADPPESNIIEATKLTQQSQCDGIIGFGGGSSMDVAKLVAVLAYRDLSLQDCYGVEQISSGRLPLVQVPTTAGTGSEATNVAIVTTGESSKQGVVSSVLYADTVLLDPQLTIGLPASVTAATGIDAMVHAIEAYTSKRLKNPVSDMLAVKALELMTRSIKRAVFEGSTIEARSDMLLGALLAGQAFSNAPVAAVHALAYPLGGLFHVPHGLSNSLVLPHVLRFNADAVPQLYNELACVILQRSKVTSGAERLAEHFLELADSVGLVTRLRDVKVSEADLPRLAEQSMLQERLLINNPRTMSYDQALDIYVQAY